MGRKKKTSKTLAKANKRLASLVAIDPKLDLGGGLTISAYKAIIGEHEGALGNYNTLLSQTDEGLNLVQRTEKKVKDWSERMLAAVAGRFGKDADEYEKAGGVRKSERKRPTRRAKAPAAK